MTGKEDSNVMTEKKRRGFSAMDESKKREIARKGGIAAHRKGTAHKFTSEEAREAGRKGGMASHAPEKMPETPMPSQEPPMQPSSDLVPAASEEPMI
jgi:general stress protein YciG